jgi:NADH-quinone oxidoreductase subunit C
MADEPKTPELPETPPTAAADKPASEAQGEPLKGEVSRTDSPGAGVSAAKPPAPAAAAKPAAPAAAAAKPAPAAGAKPAAGAAAPKPAAAHPPAAAPPSGPPDPPPPADKPVPAFITSLQAAIPGSVAHVSFWVGDWTIVVPVEHLLAAAKHLRDAPDALFDFCSDVTATDWPPRKEGRFDVVYCLFSTRLRHRVRIKVVASELQQVPSVTVLWPAADWLEREVYDMFGVNLTGHPDRRRILMPEDWQGFPERKDYPLEGPGELLLENPIDWLKLRQAREEADIE